MMVDPDCVNNLAQAAVFAQTEAEPFKQFKAELTAQEDPRILGKGDIVDYYPNCRADRQQALYKDKSFDPVRVSEEKFGKKAK
ncbi:MAG: N-sulfoglucosamine sulfohydrolase [Pirellulaceae bacterium]|jgi:N-sulfoglucosamine sulfohydrolase